MTLSLNPNHLLLVTEKLKQGRIHLLRVSLYLCIGCLLKQIQIKGTLKYRVLKVHKDKVVYK